MDEKKSGLFGSEQLLPQEEMLELATRSSSLVIGVPRETSFQENRVSMVPEAVAMVVQAGHRVIVESNAGISAHFSDHEYAEAGAELVDSRKEVFACDIVVKVAPPSMAEIEMARNRQVLFSALHMAGQTPQYFRMLGSKNVTAISFESLRDKAGTNPVMRSLSEITGSTAVLLGAEYLSSSKFGKGKMMGGFSGINPSEVVIIGAGTVGEFAARTAMGLGAVVKVFDNDIYKLRCLQNNLQARIFTSVIQPKVLRNALHTADLAIGALHARNGRSQVCVSEEMVSEMKYGAVIVDVSIDQGGCFATSHLTSHSNPVFRKHDVTHYCVPNIPSRVPHTASYALSNYLGPMLIMAGEYGGLHNLLKVDTGLRHGVYMYSGIITSKHISDTYGLPYQDLDLLMAAFQSPH
jgi:alanine dehydrogenase